MNIGGHMSAMEIRVALWIDPNFHPWHPQRPAGSPGALWKSPTASAPNVRRRYDTRSCQLESPGSKSVFAPGGPSSRRG